MQPENLSGCLKSVIIRPVLLLRTPTKMNRLITQLRRATPADCFDIYTVHRLAVRYTCLTSYTPEILEAWLALLDQDSYQAAITSKDKELWVIEYKNKISGFFLLDLQRAQLDALYVHPFLHHLGLGTALLQRAEALMLKADLSILSLYASANSTSFYTLNGYETLGEAVMPFNAKISASCTLMRKFLQ